MISIDDHPPSDPSSSDHRQQQVSHDLKSSDIDKFTDADLDDTNNQLPKFTIRDYVFGLRSKDIVSNWPFSTTSLQLCLKHGVKNLLPPFESLDSLRNKASLTRCSLEIRLTDEELIDSFDGKPTNEFKSIEKLDLESVTTNSSGSKGQRSKVQKLPSSQKPVNASAHIKKSRFVMKLNSGIEQVEEIVPNSFILSETMASKVCPVCKIFSSSSNTTLNAHIDQCLTGEGTMKWSDSSKVIVKHKVKPRKIRLMVDIYKTAPHCTIEELDRRNGTSWATNSSFPAQESQFQGEEEDKEEDKEDPKTTIVNSEVADNEGEVYIDTDGTKVRILSVPKTGSSDNHGARKLVKGVKGSKIIIGKKKNNSIYKKKHHQKVLKLISNAKKLCSPKPQARSGHEDVVLVENCKELTKVADLGITRPPWACSKRTGLSKKLNGNNRVIELQRQVRKDSFVESDKSSSKCDLGIPRNSSKKAASSQNKKKMRTSLSFIKQPLKSNKIDFRKEGNRMHDGDGDDDDDDDDDDADEDGDGDGDGDEEDEDDDDCYSPNACPSQHSDSLNTRSMGKKFLSLSKNLSFPASKFNLKRKFSDVEKSWVKSVDGSSQDSLKEQFRMEEQAVSKKNEDLRSVTSESSNGDSSVGIQAVNVDELCGVESVGNEALSSIPAPSFMGLSNSFKPEFSKQECIELYQHLICSTNRAPNDVEKHENYFQEVDPIPIPGPPGSFLPASPGGDSVSEEQIQETRIPPSENQHHHDTTENQDSMSNSPVSTVSNSRSTSVQDDTYKKSFFVTGFTENGSSHDNFKNDQPCCCSRKEVALSYQESFNVRKQPIESNRSFPSSFDFKSEMFPLRNYPNSPPPETASFPTNKRFPVSSDCDAAVSPSKPVLRLMGKNLTVVKTDDYEFRPPQSSQPPPQQPVMFSQYQNGFDFQHSNGHQWSNTRSSVDLRPNYGGFMTPMDRYGHDGSYARSQHGHNVLNFQTVSGRNGYNDFPRNEGDDSMRNEFLKRSQGQTNPLYTMYPPYAAAGGFQTSFGNGDFSKLNIGSSSPSTSHLQPSRAYYPRGYP